MRAIVSAWNLKERHMKYSNMKKKKILSKGRLTDIINPTKERMWSEWSHSSYNVKKYTHRAQVGTEQGDVALLGL